MLNVAMFSSIEIRMHVDQALADEQDGSSQGTSLTQAPPPASRTQRLGPWIRP